MPVFQRLSKFTAVAFVTGELQNWKRAAELVNLYSARDKLDCFYYFYYFSAFTTIFLLSLGMEYPSLVFHDVQLLHPQAHVGTVKSAAINGLHARAYRHRPCMSISAGTPN